MKIFIILSVLLSSTAWSFERSPLESIPDQGKHHEHQTRNPSSERKTIIKTDEVKIKMDKAKERHEKE